MTPDGKVYTAGDVSSEVSIQSISKVFTMAKVMEEQGPDAIEKRIGVDATGMRFNSIVSVEFAQKALGGPEIQWARRENFRDGFTSDDLRIQFSVKYNFSHTFGGN